MSAVVNKNKRVIAVLNLTTTWRLQLFASSLVHKDCYITGIKISSYTRGELGSFCPTPNVIKVCLQKWPQFCKQKTNPASIDLSTRSKSVRHKMYIFSDVKNKLCSILQLNFAKEHVADLEVTRSIFVVYFCEGTYMPSALLKMSM